MRGFALAVLCLLGIVQASTARAQPRPRAHLEYVRDVGADACPDELALRNAAAARLGSDPFWPVAPLRISVVMDAAEGTLRARVLLRDGESGKALGVRRLSSNDADCSELFDAMVLAVCIAIDPESSMRDDGDPRGNAEEAPPPEPEAQPARPQAHDAVSLPSSRPGRPPKLELRVTLGALLALGTSPVPAPGLATGFGVRYGRASLDLEARADLPIDKTVGRDLSVQAAPLLIGLVPCAHLAGPLALCAVAWAGALRGEASDNEAQLTPMLLIGGRLAAELPLGAAFFLRLHGEIVGNLTPTEQQVDGVEKWSTSPVAAATGLATGWRF